jgi:hypothetical protein
MGLPEDAALSARVASQGAGQSDDLKALLVPYPSGK